MNEFSSPAVVASESPPARPSLGARWVPLATFIACIACTGTLAGLGYGALQSLKAELALARVEARQVAEENQRAAAAFKVLPVEKMPHACTSNALEIDCTFTNPLLDEAIGTCVFARVTNKTNRAQKIESLRICSGRLAPMTTHRITTAWSGDRPIDICTSRSGYGNHESLDLSQCTFEVVNAPPETTK